MNTQILKILNPVRIYTQAEWMEIVAIRMIDEILPKKSVANLLELESIQLMQRFEELTRGKLISIDTSKHTPNREVWQPVLLTRDMFEAEEYYEDTGIGKDGLEDTFTFWRKIEKPENYDACSVWRNRGRLDKFTHDEEMACKAYDQAQEKVWFEYTGSEEDKENAIRQALLFGKYTDMWEFIKQCDGGKRWNYTENFLKQLLK